MMDILQSAIFGLLAFGILVTIHELGHYVVARLCGVTVLRFSIGMGRAIWSRRFGKDKTEWSIAIFPLGGYVKMLDARELDVTQLSAQELQGEFTRKSVWQRMAIVIAGPVANFLLAIVVYTFVYHHGMPDPVAKISVPSSSSIAFQSGLRHGDLVQAVNGETVRSWSELQWSLQRSVVKKQNVVLRVTRTNPDRSTSSDQLELTLALSQIETASAENDFLKKLGFGLYFPPAVLKEVVSGGPGSRAGLRAGDKIIAIDDKPILDSLGLIEVVNASPNKPLKMLVQSGQQEFEVKITPEPKEENGKVVGKIQVLPTSFERVDLSYTLLESLPKAVERTWDTSILTLKMMGKLLTGELSLKNISGPISIADYAGQTAKIGAIAFIQFLALISISLGVMNLLPIPVLDGGHLLYYSLEVLFGKPIPEKYAEMAQRGGLVVLLCLMVVAFFNDIVQRVS
jgi:regulator of sigma E protease